MSRYQGKHGFPGSIHAEELPNGKVELWVQLNDPFEYQVEWIRLGELLECMYDDNLYDIDLLYELIDKWKAKTGYLPSSPPSCS